MSTPTHSNLLLKIRKTGRLTSPMPTTTTILSVANSLPPYACDTSIGSAPVSSGSLTTSSPGPVARANEATSSICEPDAQSDRVLAPGYDADFFLKHLSFQPENEMLALECVRYRIQNLVSDARELCLQVEQRH